MQLKHFTLAALAGSASAQSLTSVLSNQTDLSNLTSYLGMFPNLASTVSGLSNITLLAPNNDAFSAFLNSSEAQAVASNTDAIRAILTYHVLNGTYYNVTNTTFIPSELMMGAYANVTGGQRVEAVSSGSNITFYSGLLMNSSVVGSSMNFSGGVIHVIDRLLTLPQNVSQTAIDLNLTAAVGALTQLNLTETVDTTPDLTVFVPNNAAFQAIGSAVSNLSMQDLTGILSYHVVSGTVGYSTTLMNGSMLQTLEGTNVTVTVNGSDIYVNNARVVLPDVLVANGVVHVIDEVLNPMNMTAGEGESAYGGASNSTDVPFTSGVPTPTSAINTGSIETAKSSAAGSSTSNPGFIAAHPTGAMAPLALFGGAAVFLNM